MENFINIAKGILLTNLPHDGVFVNYTMSDGYDTLYMAQYVSEGNVVAFADNREKLESAYKLLECNFQDNAHIVLDNPLNMEKYITSPINGFILDADNVKMSDKDVIDLVRISLGKMKAGRRGMVMITRAKSKVIKYIEKLNPEHTLVMHIGMANMLAPDIYIIEKR